MLSGFVADKEVSVPSKAAVGVVIVVGRSFLNGSV